MEQTPPPVPHTLTLSLEDGQTTIKGHALVALADATDATARALIDVLAARQAAADADGRDLGRLVMAARRSADKADWLADRSLARANLARAAALLVAAIETIDTERIESDVDEDLTQLVEERDALRAQVANLASRTAH